MLKYFFCLILALLISTGYAEVLTGIDQLSAPEELERLKGKRVAIMTNQTGITRKGESTLDVLKSKAKDFKIVKLFAPEHGLKGQSWASDPIADSKDPDGIPIVSLYGKTRRPTAEMLKGIDLIIYDIQDIGSRSYTFISSLFYLMEEAAKHKIKVLVLDRPNPINGVTIDGPMLDHKFRSFVGYINVPYCHGMTIGELARFFNAEYKINCPLEVIPMKGWQRRMTFADTKLPWVPTSPNVPESDTPLYYPMTGILGELSVVSIGVGYTLPFKLVGAPWIQGEKFAEHLNKLKLPGVQFRPFYFRPFSGKYKNENCEGALIIVSKPLLYKPVTTQYAIIDTLKKLYAKKFKEAVKTAPPAMFNKVNGTELIFTTMQSKNQWLTTLNFYNNERKAFEEARKKYLLPYPY